MQDLALRSEIGEDLVDTELHGRDRHVVDDLAGLNAGAALVGMILGSMPAQTDHDDGSMYGAGGTVSRAAADRAMCSDLPARPEPQ